MKPERNQAIECARMVAACFVVFIHCTFPGSFGELIVCLGEFAVPLFFVISGYFCFGASSDKIWGRMKRIGRLYLLSAGIYILWNCFTTEFHNGSVVAYLRSAAPEMDEIARFLFLNIPFYAYQLWYLLAMVVCYFILWGYARFFGEQTVNYRPLYIVGICLLADNIAAGAVMEEVVRKNTVPFYFFRSALFTGIPMIALGIFLREFQTRILDNFHLSTAKQGLLILAGIFLSVIQWRGGVSTGNLYFGTIVGIVGWMLFLAAHPGVTVPERFLGKCISHFGFWSTAIYVLHLISIEAYVLFVQLPMETLLGPSEPWFRPLVVLGMSLFAAILCDGLRSLVKRK